ncbi:MSHA biogenesis protein MshP [Shewanella maritima]|uniref:MSHA biogenesis protein MshP n=1 Tax=Shewanella maritima TaxID=2520507 RepID=A0A411PGZ4_9GAMM|nr:MSHA biogenesis protein MshP [Shewanella maritima]QBF82778.1 MSHA biogenesis protein MshP [Shewanella maritima]
MYLSGKSLNQLSAQRGSALVIGIFVIIVMFLLAGSLLRIVEDADEALSMEVWGTRALNSANSGADAALAQLFPLGGVVQTCAAVSASWTPPNTLGFHGCSVSISCSAATVGADTQFTINSSATCETGGCGTDDSTNCLRVNRQVEVEARGN